MDKIRENLDKLSFAVSNFLSLNRNSSQEKSKLFSLVLLNPFEIHFAKKEAGRYLSFPTILSEIIVASYRSKENHVISFGRFPDSSKLRYVKIIRDHNLRMRNYTRESRFYVTSYIRVIIFLDSIRRFTVVRSLRRGLTSHTDDHVSSTNFFHQRIVQSFTFWSR